jgi:hypothetical protein
MILYQKFADNPTPEEWARQTPWPLPSARCPGPIRQAFQDRNVARVELTFNDGSALRYERNPS